MDSTRHRQNAATNFNVVLQEFRAIGRFRIGTGLSLVTFKFSNNFKKHAIKTYFIKQK